MSMFPSHPRDPTYWPGGSICVSAPIWRHKTADPSKLQIISSSLQSATIRNTSSPPTPQILLITLHKLMPVLYCDKF